MRSGRWLCLAFAVFVPGAAGAQELIAAAGGACEHAQGVADAQAALLVAPDAFASLGFTSASLNGDALGSPTPRINVGLEYSVSRLFQGLTVKRRAGAECARAQALAQLAPALAQGSELGALPALEARARVLTEALPQAEKLIAEVSAEVADGRASREELDALAQQLQALRTLAHQTQADRAKLTGQPPVSPTAFRHALAEYRQANVRYEALSGSLRAQSAWDLRVRGGYEKLLNVDQSVPLFGLVTVSYNLGGLFQGGANARAVEGVRKMDVSDASGVGQQVRQLLGGLKAQLDADTQALAETRTRLADLDGQAHALEALQTHQVDRFRRAVFFERISAQAQTAYLDAHVQSLGALLKESP